MAWETAETETILKFFREALTQSTTSHSKIFNTLLSRQGATPLELGEMLEDIGNLYLSMAECISEKSLLSRRSNIE